MMALLSVKNTLIHRLIIEVLALLWRIERDMALLESWLTPEKFQDLQPQRASGKKARPR